MDRVFWKVLEQVCGQKIPKEEEGLGWEETLEGVTVEGLDSQSLQRWLVEMPVRMGGLELTNQEDLSPLAFLGSLIQTIPYLGGETGVCPPLAHLVGRPGDQQWEPLLQSNGRTGLELMSL